MRFWQKSVLGLLAITTVTVLGGTAAILHDGGAVPAAVARQAPDPPPSSTAPSASNTASPTSPAPSPTATPFQPVARTPTPTSSPTSTSTPLPTNTPDPTATPAPLFPPQASIEGIWGFPQAFNLSCESRSASDLARYFGVFFTELEFLYALPSSDNPESGFVGDVRGYLGQLPPYGYGVHAKPVAELLRSFGLPAAAHRNMTLDDLKVEIAAGRPVMIWAISDMGYSPPVEYTPSDGQTVIVARYEHTFIVIAYNRSRITILDNERAYSVSTEQFRTSWSALGNMSITIFPPDE